MHYCAILYTGIPYPSGMECYLFWSPAKGRLTLFCTAWRRIFGSFHNEQNVSYDTEQRSISHVVHNLPYGSWAITTNCIHTIRRNALIQRPSLSFRFINRYRLFCWLSTSFMLFQSFLLSSNFLIFSRIRENNYQSLLHVIKLQYLWLTITKRKFLQTEMLKTGAFDGNANVWKKL